MLDKDSKYEWRQSIFRAIKPFFTEKIGKFTHQRITEDWHFRGLGFVRDDMTYVFGFNIGFFRKSAEKSNYEFDYVGSNVLIRTNGENEGLRLKYKDFFDKHLEKWILEKEDVYTSFRGGVGIEFPRTKRLDSFENDEKIIEFLKDNILRLSDIWPYIASNPENIFSHVVRGAPPWDETLIEIALKRAANTQ